MIKFLCILLISIGSLIINVLNVFQLILGVLTLILISCAILIQFRIEYLTFISILIYVCCILVLFLFTVFMLKIEFLIIPPVQFFNFYFYLVFLIFLKAFMFIYFFNFNLNVELNSKCMDFNSQILGFNDSHLFTQIFFKQQCVFFTIVGLIILLSLVGTIILCNNKNINYLFLFNYKEYAISFLVVFYVFMFSLLIRVSFCCLYYFMFIYDNVNLTLLTVCYLLTALFTLFFFIVNRLISPLILNYLDNLNYSTKVFYFSKDLLRFFNFSVDAICVLCFIVFWITDGNLIWWVFSFLWFFPETEPLIFFVGILFFCWFEDKK